MLLTIQAVSAQILLFSLVSLILATPLHLDLPILINLNSTILSPVNTAPLNYDPCFEPRSDLFPTNYVDCHAAIREMFRTSDMGRYYTFGRGDGATYKLPKTFSSGSCIVNLDMIYDEQTDRLTIPEVRQAALDLAAQCTTGTDFNLGGIEAVKPRNVLCVTIFGSRS